MEKQVYVKFMLRDLMFHVTDKGTTVVQYPYRTAMLNNMLMQFPRYDAFEAMLAKKAEKHIDNHTLYKVTLKDGSTFAIMCHDAVMYLGLGITEKYW